MALENMNTFATTDLTIEQKGFIEAAVKQKMETNDKNAYEEDIDTVFEAVVCLTANVLNHQIKNNGPMEKLVFEQVVSDEIDGWIEIYREKDLLRQGLETQSMEAEADPEEFTEQSRLAELLSPDHDDNPERRYIEPDSRVFAIGEYYE